VPLKVGVLEAKLMDLPCAGVVHPATFNVSDIINALQINLIVLQRFAFKE
jgi:hypothetical protein